MAAARQAYRLREAQQIVDHDHDVRRFHGGTRACSTHAKAVGGRGHGRRSVDALAHHGRGPPLAGQAPAGAQLFLCQHPLAHARLRTASSFSWGNRPARTSVMPAASAPLLAVRALSPVSMTVVTPRACNSVTARRAPARTVSATANSPSTPVGPASRLTVRP